MRSSFRVVVYIEAWMCLGGQKGYTEWWPREDGYQWEIYTMIPWRNMC